MENLLKLVLLGIIQGLTEFLPVSSSGHLVLSEHFLEFDVPGILIEVSLHVGTLLAILAYFRLDISRLIIGCFKGENEERRYVLYVLLSSLPAVLAYVILGETLESFFDNAFFASVMLCVTGCMLLISKLKKESGQNHMSIVTALAIGIAQAFAILPGISRSGITIVTGKFSGLPKHDSARFSLLMSVPVVAGAGLLKVIEVASVGTGEIGLANLITGVLVSALIGYFAICVLMKTISRNSFWMFGIYCLVAGAAAVLAISQS